MARTSGLPDRVAPLAAGFPVLLFSSSALAANTLRLDYFHTGGVGTEVFAVDRIVIEPLPWPGRPGPSVDATGTGTYRFEVRDAKGQVIYSRGYSSIYAEWTATAEAQTAHRTFHESLRFPEPPGPVQVTVQKRTPTQEFATVWTTQVDPADMYV